MNFLIILVVLFGLTWARHREMSIHVLSWKSNSDTSFQIASMNAMTVECALDERCGDRGGQFKLFRGQQLLATDPCINYEYEFGAARFRIDIANYTDMNELTCKYDDNECSVHSLELSASLQDPQIPYLYCPSGGSDCANAHCPTDDGKKKFCLWTPQGIQPCRASFDPSWCAADKDPYWRYCPVDAKGFCSAMVKNSELVWYAVSTSGECLPGLTSSPVSYNGKTVKVGEYIVVDPANPVLRLDCPEGSPLYGKVAMSEYDDNKKCWDHYNFTFTPTEDVSVKVWSFAMENMHFACKAVSFGRVSVAVNWHRVGSELVCNRINGPSDITARRHNFDVTVWWTRSSTSRGSVAIPSSATFKRGYILRITEDGEYQCHANVTFKACSPFFTASHVVHSEPLLASNVRTSTSVVRAPSGGV